MAASVPEESYTVGKMTLIHSIAGKGGGAAAAVAISVAFSGGKSPIPPVLRAQVYLPWTLSIALKYPLRTGICSSPLLSTMTCQ